MAKKKTLADKLRTPAARKKKSPSLLTMAKRDLDRLIAGESLAPGNPAGRTRAAGATNRALGGALGGLMGSLGSKSFGMPDQPMYADRTEPVTPTARPFIERPAAATTTSAPALLARTGSSTPSGAPSGADVLTPETARKNWRDLLATTRERMPAEPPAGTMASHLVRARDSGANAGYGTDLGREVARGYDRLHSNAPGGTMQVGVPGSGITPLNPRPQAGTAAAAARAEGRPLPSTGSIESIARDKIADYMQGGGETMPKGLGEQHFETLKGLPQRIAQIGKDAAIDEAVGAMTKGRGGSSIFTGNVSNTQPRPETGNVISDLQMNLFERGKARRPQFASPEERALNRRTRREAVGAARKQRMDMRGLQAQGIPPNLALMMTSGGGDNDFLRTAAMVGGRNAVERERNTFLDQRNKDTAAYNEGLLGIKQQEVDEAKRLGDVGIAKEFYGEGGIPRNVQEGLAPGLTRQLNLPTPEEQAEVDYIVKTTPRRGVFTGAKDRNKDIARRIREYGTKLGWDELLIESEIQRASPTAWW